MIVEDDLKQNRQRPLAFGEFGVLARNFRFLSIDSNKDI